MEKEARLFLSKATNKDNTISLDLADIKECLKGNIRYFGCATFEGDTKDAEEMVKDLLIAADITIHPKIGGALLYMEIPEHTSLQKVIEIVGHVNEQLCCNARFAIGKSASSEVKIHLVAYD